MRSLLILATAIAAAVLVAVTAGCDAQITTAPCQPANCAAGHNDCCPGPGCVDGRCRLPADPAELFGRKKHCPRKETNINVMVDNETPAAAADTASANIDSQRPSRPAIVAAVLILTALAAGGVAVVVQFGRRVKAGKRR